MQHDKKVGSAKAAEKIAAKASEAHRQENLEAATAKDLTTIYDRMLAAGGYWYLATPYSKFPLGREAAFIEACVVAGHFIKMGIPVFSPIAHSHPISEKGGIDPNSHDIWLPADRPLMLGAVGLVVTEMQGWRDSYGMQEEIKEFIAAGKPIENFQPYGRCLPCR